MNQPEPTRNALLAAATELFATLSYDATSVRAITARAGANLGAITYHFGSKEALYHAVLKSMWAPVLGHLERVAAAPGEPLDRIEAALRELFVTLGRQPEVAPIMLREIARAGAPPPPLQESVRRLFGLLSGLILAGQADGTIVEGDAHLLGLSLLAQPFHIMSLRHKMGPVIGVEADRAPVFERIVDNAVAFARRGLTRQEHNP